MLNNILTKNLYLGKVLRQEHNGVNPNKVIKYIVAYKKKRSHPFYVDAFDKTTYPIINDFYTPVGSLCFAEMGPVSGKNGKVSKKILQGELNELNEELRVSSLEYLLKEINKLKNRNLDAYNELMKELLKSCTLSGETIVDGMSSLNERDPEEYDKTLHKILKKQWENNEKQR